MRQIGKPILKNTESATPFLVIGEKEHQNRSQI